MKITQIDLKNFRAFYGEHTIKLKDGKSLLVLGENGSGKSSVYFALKDFFEAYERGLDITKTPYRNLFATTSETSVRLHFDNGETFEWSNSENSPHGLTSQNLDVIRGFIDYKSLLQTYFFQQSHDRVNVFQFIVDEVLADYQPLSSKRTIKQYWKRIRIPQRNTALQLQAISFAIDEFNQNLSFALKELQAKAQAILDDFGINLIINLNFGGVTYNRAKAWKEKAIENKLVNLRVKFYDQDHENHHQYLNEAKLSATAIALYFASFLIRPEGKLNVLALDDVLIGLDIANRDFVLKVVDQYFKQFQVFIFTYDEVWFDRLRGQFNDWQKLTLYSVNNGTFEFPMVKDQLSYVAKAEQLLDENDKRSAANMARQYFEEITKGVCDKKAIKIRYRRKAKLLKLDDLWKGILDVPDRVPLNAQLITDITSDIATVYNPFSHGNPVNVSSDDVRKAIDRLKALKIQFDS